MNWIRIFIWMGFLTSLGFLCWPMLDQGPKLTIDAVFDPFSGISLVFQFFLALLLMVYSNNQMNLEPSHFLNNLIRFNFPILIIALLNAIAQFIVGWMSLPIESWLPVAIAQFIVGWMSLLIESWLPVADEIKFSLAGWAVFVFLVVFVKRQLYMAIPVKNRRSVSRDRD